MREPPEDARGGYQSLRIPCGSCLGCRKAKALEWAHRCWLESQAHEEQCWVTLTYDDQNVPPQGLVKDHLASWLKRLRSRVAPRQVRFFASGEYGDTTQRPHYHAILFGLSRFEVEHELEPRVNRLTGDEIMPSWTFGFARTDPLTPAAIAYVAGYVAKKIGWHSQFPHEWGEYEQLDRDTGEVIAGRYKNYLRHPPFVVMSRRPGIGAHAKRFWQSWRSHAVYHDRPIPVPRFLHQAYEENASAWDLFNLQQEKLERSKTRDTTRARLEAAEKIAQAFQSHQSSKRSKL